MNKFYLCLSQYFRKFSRKILLLCILLLPFIVNAQTADFSISLSSHCGNGSVTFTDVSGPEPVTKWNWDFGNSNTLETFNPTLGLNPLAIYPSPGVYTVSLAVNDGSPVSKTITIYPIPEPNFSPSVTLGCEPLDVVLTASTNNVDVAPYMIGSSNIGGVVAGAITSYQWDFQGKIAGVTEYDNVLDLSSLPANDYGVFLLVSDEYGCERAYYEPSVFSVNATPTVDFSITKQNLCGLGAVDLEAIPMISSGSISEYQWDIENDGSLEALSKIYTHTFSLSGTFDIALKLKSDEGCFSSKVVKQIEFNDNNSSDFTYSGACADQTITFTDVSSANAIGWSWDFNNDDIEDSNLQNPTTIFNTAGDYEVSLKVSHSDGCEMDVSKIISIIELTSAFTYVVNGACPPDYSVNFTDASGVTTGNITSWSWDFNGDNIEDSNIQNPSYNFSSSGSHDVKLTVSSDNGCSVSTTEEIIIEDKFIDFTTVSDSRICTSESVSFLGSYSDELNDPVSTWRWSFESEPLVASGKTPSHIYNARGEYDVTLTVNTLHGCELSVTKTEAIQVGAKPILTDVTYPFSNCKESSVEFTSTFTGLADSLYWNFSNGINATSNFVDGDSPQMINHNFIDDGSHTVTVIAYDNSCASDPFNVSNIVINQPVARFTVSDNVQCNVPATVQFTNNSSSDALATTHTWDFGDGNSSSQKNPTHTYVQAGDYTVSLSVYNLDTGCTDVVTEEVYVTSSDLQFITDKTIVCYPAEIKFTNQIITNSSANFTIASVEWDFDNNGSIESTDLDPAYTYASPDLYDVKLAVTEERGCVYNVIQSGYLSVNGPVASFIKNPLEACLGNEISFTNTSSLHDDDPADSANDTFFWNFGDGVTSTNENPQHTYASENNFTVSLEVSDENGCSSTVVESNSVIVPNITANFTTSQDSYCVGESVGFTNTSSIINGSATITLYEWDLDGDGSYEISTSSSADQSFMYPTAGTITIKQRISSSLGCTDEFTKEISIVDGDGTFTADETNLGCAPSGTTFHATDDDSMVSNYHWDFGDGETAISREPIHFYVNPGSYDVELTVDLTGGCTKSSIQTVVVTGPVGEFLYNSTFGCATPEHEVIFEAKNMKYVTELTWDFGIGVTHTQSIPLGTTEVSYTYNYTTKGTKLPILILTDDGTCGAFSYIREDLGRINTSTVPTVDFSKSSGLNICENVEIQFSDLSILTDDRYQIVSWEWDFNEDGIIDSNEKNPKYTYGSAGDYDVTLTVTTDFNCKESLTKTDFITVVSPNNLTNVLISTTELADQNHKVCSGEGIDFAGSASSTNGDGSIFSWHWNFGDGAMSTTQNETYAYDSSLEGSTQTVTLTVTDNSQCVKTVTTDISIYEVIADFSITSSPVLRGNTINFADLSTTKINAVTDGVIDDWAWTFENGSPLSATVETPSISYNTIGSNFDVTLISQNNEGCTASVSKTVNVLNNPPIVSDFMVMGNEDTHISIPRASFDTNYDTSLDPTQDPLEKVKIISLPDHGDLYNGASIISSAGIELSYADLAGLIFIPDDNWNGSAFFDYNAYDSYVYAMHDATVTINVTQVEDAPVITDVIDTQNKDVSYVIQLSDFVDHFSDLDYDVDNDGLADTPENDFPHLQAVKITSLPTAAMGTLKWNGTNVSNQQVFTVSDLTSYNLIFEPTLGFVDDAIFTWNAYDGAEYAVADANVLINYFNTKSVLTNENLGSTIKEDVVVTITQANFIANHSDIDVNDDPFDKIKIVSLVADGGSFEFNSSVLAVNQEINYADLTNNITFTPAIPVGGYNGTIQLVWDTFDGTEWSAGTATFSFTYVNTKPLSGIIGMPEINEDTQVDFTATDFDNQFSDIDFHDVLTKVKIKTLPSYGTLKLSGSNVSSEQEITVLDLVNLVYHPNEHYNGSDSFTWCAYDGSEYSDVDGTVNLSIYPIQDKPTVSNISKTAVEDNNVQITRADFEANFSDVDKPYEEPKSDDLEEITIINLPSNGTLQHNGVDVDIDGVSNVIAVADIDNGTGLVFIPNPGYEGNSSFDWNGSDGLDYADVAAKVIITHDNTPPVVSNYNLGNQLEDVVITFTRTNLEDHYTDDNATDTQFEKIEVLALPNASIGKFQLNSVDLTIGEYTFSELLNGLVFTPLPGANGTVNLVWNAFDGTEYAASSATFSFTYINSVPTVSNFSKTAVDEDNNVIFATIDFTDNSFGNYSDVDVNDLFGKIKITDLPNNGTLKYGATTVTLNAEIPYSELANLIYQPNQHWFGNDSFKWQGYDGTDYSLESTVSLTVNSINDAPIAENESVTVLEDQTHTFTALQFSNSYSDNYFSENSSFAGIKIDPLESAGYLKLNGVDVTLGQELNLTDIPNLTFTTNADENGAAYATFGFKVYDGEDYSTSIYTMTVNVIPVNDEPSFVLKASPDITLDEDYGAYSGANHAISISPGPANESSQILNFELSNTNNSLFNVQPIISSNGELTFTTAPNAYGSATVTVYITDNGGLANSGDNQSDSQTFIITISSVNDIPTAANEFVTELEDVSYAFASSDFSDSYSDVETVMAGIEITGLEGVGNLEYDGTPVTIGLQIATADISKLKFIPVADENGNNYDSFTFKVFDGEAYSTNSYIMTVNITSVNDEPSFTFIATKNIVIDEDNGTKTVVGQIATQSAGPADESSQNLNLHVSHTNSGLFSVDPAINAAGTLTFTPTPNAFGVSTVTVYITDNGGLANSGDDTSDSQTFTITINSVNDIPTAANEFVTELEDVSYTFTSSDFSDSYSDVETAMAGIEITGLESVGNLEYDGNPVAIGLQIATADISKLKFIPVANENGNNYDSFTFKVFDGEAYSTNSYVMTMNITLVNDEPTFAFKAPKDVEVDEDSGATTVNGQLISQFEGATNENAQSLTIHISNNNNALFAVQPVIDASGNLNFTPVDDTFGTATVSVYMTDDGGLANGGDDTSITQTFTITINAVNDSPVAKDDSFTINEDVQLSGNLQVDNGNGIDSDVDSDSSNFIYTIVDGGTADTNGTISLNSDGTFTYDADEDYFGTISFTYQVCDDAVSPLIQGCYQATVTITVNATNDIPVAVNDTNTTDEDSSVNGNVLTNDTNLGDAPVTVISNTNPINGAVIVNADGTYIYTPNADFFGTDSFDYTIEDVDGEKSTATVTITVNSINDEPVAVNDIYSTNEDTSVSGNVLTNDTDLGDAPVTVVSNTDPLNGNVTVNADGNFTYTPNADFFGIDNFNYTIEDLNGDQSFTTVIVTVLAINDTPLAVNDLNLVDEDSSVNGNVLTNDTNLGDAPVTVISNTNPANGNVTVNADGTYTYTPNADFFGTDNFDYTIEDVDGEQSTATVSITVNPTDDDPLAVDDSLWLKEDASISGNVFDNDERLVDIPVTILTNTNPTHGILVINPDGTFIYTPTSGYFGNDSFTYTLHDLDGDQSTATVSIIVDPLDYDPIANDDSDTINEDETSSGDLFANDEGFINTPVLVFSNTNPANGLVVVNTDGTYLYTPNPDFFGTDTFTYTLEDSDGDQDTATVTITVNPVNDTPLAVDDNYTLDEDDSVSGSLLDNDTNLGDAIVSVISNTDTSNGILSINPDGTFVYTPNADFFGTDNFDYTIEDVDGEQSTARVTITVNATNDIPVAVNDTNTTDEDVAVNGNVLTNDTNLGDAPVTVVSNTNPANGNVTVNADGTYIYIPNADFYGTDSFDYTIEDVDGEQSTARVTITVNAINDTPVAVDDTNTTDEDTSVAGNVLPNDTDIDLDLDDLSVININGDSGLVGTDVAIADGGIVRLNSDGSYSFDPNGEFDYLNTGETVQLSFTYVVNDGVTNSNEAIVVITIVGVNDAPVANNDDLDVRDNEEIIISVLDNDIDADGDDLAVAIISNPEFGNVVVNADGTLTYIANLGAYCQTDQFTYRICDPEGLCDDATVTIEIRVMDTDEDSIPDAVETLTLDTDGDAELNYQDLDSDNDGISDEDEAQIENSCSDLPIDTDGDTIPDYLDTDSDNDGFTDEEEGNDDCDGDGIADYIDAYDDCDDYVSVPEGFSPNGDGVNDRFVIKGIKDFPNSKLMIFNRWGNRIFKTRGYLNNWDGRADNKMTIGSKIVPEGTYYYILELESGKKPIKGYIYINY